MRLGKEDWVAWIRGSGLEKLRAFWIALYISGGPVVKKFNISQTRGILVKYLEERPDDWEFEWVPQQEMEVEPAVDEAIAEEEVPTVEAEIPEKNENKGKRIDKRRFSWANVITSVILGLVAVTILLAILSAGGVITINSPFPAKTTPATQAILEPNLTATPKPESETSTTITYWNPTPIAWAEQGKNFSSGWDKDWYWSPFRDTTDRLDDEATWQTFAEPGVLLDNTAAFDYLSAAETPINAPEGGFAYIAVGGINLSHNGYSIDLAAQVNNIYLIIIRGLPDDATDADLNQQVWASNYPRGFGIYSPMPYGAYVSLGWFLQQIENAQESSGDPNCGADGCDKITVVVIELQSHSYRMWEITGDPRDWTRVQ